MAIQYLRLDMIVLYVVNMHLQAKFDQMAPMKEGRMQQNSKFKILDI